MIPTFKEYKEGIKFNHERKEAEMPLPKYNLDGVEASIRKKYPAGEWFFEIVEAKEKTAGTGTDYTSLVLEVETSEGNAKVYDNVYYSEKALFKLKQIVDSTGIKPPEDTIDYIGATGKAKFLINKDGFLFVKWYISKADAALNDSPEIKKAKETFSSPENPEDIPL